MKRNKRSVAWKVIGGLLVGGVIGALGGIMLRRPDAGVAEAFAHLDPLQWVLLLAGAAVTVLAVLAVHEAGHLLAGRLVGFRFLLFIAGPVRVAREGGQVRLGWNRNLSLAGGLAATGPTPDRLERLRQRTAVMVAGGPAVSLLAGLAGGALYLSAGLHEGGLSGPAGVLPRLAAIFALGSLAIAVVTLFPGRTSGFLTDGSRLLQLLRGGPRAEADAALVGLMAWSMAGARPRDWDPALVENALRDDDGPFHALALHHAWRHAADSGNEAVAEAHRKALIGSLHDIPEAARPGILLDLATDAALAWNPAEAELLLEAAGEGGPLDDGFQRPLAEAALAAVDGRPEEALARADRAQALLDQTMDASATAPARERIEQIRAMAASGLAEELLEEGGPGSSLDYLTGIAEETDAPEDLSELHDDYLYGGGQAADPDR